MSTDRAVNVVDGPLFKPLMVLSVPIMAGQMLQVGYNLADTYWVGRIGPDAVAALSYAWAIVFLMVSIGAGLTIAGTVLVAQHKGAGNFTETHHIAGQTLSFVTLIALAFAIVGYILTPWLVSLVGATPGTEPYQSAVGYTRIIFLGVWFMFWFFIYDALSRGWGDTRTPLYLMAVSVTINVIIDPFLILGFTDNPIFGWFGLAWLESQLFASTGFTGWGVEGAAVGTVISRGIAAIVGLWLLFAGRVGLQPKFSDLLLQPDSVREIVSIGFPSAIELGMRALGIAVLTAIIALAGDNAVASYGIVNRLSSLLFMPALGLARGTETVVGQNLGANQVARARRAVGLSSGVILAAFSVVILAAYPNAEAIVAFFLDTDAPGDTQSVIEVGAAYIWIAGPTYLALGVFQMMLGGIRGSGSTRAAMLFSIQELWILRLPLAYVLLAWVGMGVIGVWWAVAIAHVVATITTGIWFLRGSWTDSVVTESPTASASSQSTQGETDSISATENE